MAEWQSDGCTGAAWTAEPCADPDWQRDGCDPLAEWKDDTPAEDIFVIASPAVIDHKSGRAGVHYGDNLFIFATSAQLDIETNPAIVLVGEDLFIVATTAQMDVETNAAIVQIILSPSACPTETNWTSYAEGQGTTAADRVGARVKIASDAQTMVVASWQDQNLVHVFERGQETKWSER